MSNRTALANRSFTAIVLAFIIAITVACGGNGSNNTTTGNHQALSIRAVFVNLSFSSPVAMLQAPNDDTRWFVVERGSSSRNAKVIVFPNNDAVTSAQTTQFISLPVNASGEGGLLGMAFHPHFPTTPLVYLSYTRAGPDAQHPLTTVISRFTSADGGATLDPASEHEVLTLGQPFTNHNGGHIAFGPDSLLYIGLGDGGSGNDPLNHGQNINTLFGAMLRVDIDAVPAPQKQYAIPGDNPFAQGGGAPEIYAWGLRNPWRWSFDRDTDRLWLGDVGQGAWEEVNIIQRGGNYGWRVCEGAHLRGTSTPCANPAFIDPITEYDHSRGCSITGGYVYRGTEIPGLNGLYLFGDFCTGTIWSLQEISGARPLVEVVSDTNLSLVSFAQSNNGELYVVNLGGTLHKIVAAP